MLPLALQQLTDDMNERAMRKRNHRIAILSHGSVASSHLSNFDHLTYAPLYISLTPYI